MWNEPRNWKWMLPGVATVGMFVLAGRLWVESNFWWLIMTGGFGLIFLVATITNWWTYVQLHGASVYTQIRNAQNKTTEVMLFEYASRMHPDAVAALLSHRRLIWRVKYVSVGELVDWVLDEAPSVHVGFVDFVLEHSSHTSLMPKSVLSDGSKQLDPEGQVTDYEQYDSLLMVMQQRLMCTQAFGNQSPRWIDPWNPETARRRFGLVEGEYNVESHELLPAMVRAERWKQANGPAQNAAEADWVENTLHKNIRGWDPQHPKSALATELVGENEITKGEG